MSKAYNNFTNEIINSLQNVADTILDVKKENDNLQEKINNLEYNNDILQKQLEEIKADIVLTKTQINREGRPKELTNEDIEFIKSARSEGLSLRKIGEMIDKSHTTVSRVLKEYDKKNNSDKSVKQMKKAIGKLREG